MSDPVISQDNARGLHDENQRYALPHQVIKNYAIEVCQLLFGDKSNPLGLIWSPEEEKSQVRIFDKHSFNLDHVGTNPAIVANRGPQAWAKTSGFRQMQSMDMRTDTRTYIDLVRGSVILSCFSRQGLEAEDIAGFLFESFQVFRDVLRKIARRGIIVPHHLGFFRIEASSMGEEALVKSDSRPDISVVPVAIQATVQRRYSVEPTTSKKLKQIEIRTSRSGQ
jgi:hypothetical protein